MTLLRTWKRLWAAAPILGLLGFRFAIDVVVSTLIQTRLVFSPRVEIRPAWIEYDSRLRTPAARTALGVLISLTPGTVTADLRGNRLTVHLLNQVPGVDEAARIRERFERPLQRLEAL